MTGDRFRGTRRMILRRVLVVPLVTMMLLFATLTYYFASNLRCLEEARLIRIAQGHRDLIEQFLRERSADLRYVVASNSFEDIISGGRLATILGELQRHSPAFLDMGVFDHRGNHVAYVGPYELQGRSYAHTEWFRHVREKNIYISDVFLGYRNVPHFVIAVGREGAERWWCLRSTIDSLFFSKLVENVRVEKTGEAYLINHDGAFQTRRRSGGDLMEMDPDHATYRAEEASVAAFTAKNASGGRHLYATGRISPTAWLLVVRQEIGEAYAPLTRAVLVAGTAIVVGGVVAFSIAFVLASGVASELMVAEAEKRRMGSELLMAGRLAELGEMSTGIAHEINNPLQVIKTESAYLGDILEKIKEGRSGDHTGSLQLMRESIDQINVQVDRSKEITRGLLKFACQIEPQIRAIDLPTLLSDIARALKRRAQGKGIRIVEEIAPDLPALRTDPNQLQQVFLNLLNNAFDALREDRPGEIRITAARSDHELTVSVADNGCGIPPEHLEKVFLPFFTTKPPGRGTGLGLSACYGIVEGLGGRITVASELNVGSVFTVQLPLDGPSGEAT